MEKKFSGVAELKHIGIWEYQKKGLLKMILSECDVKKIIDQAFTAANAEDSLLRIDKSGKKAKTKMHVIVVNRGGKVVGQKSMDDAWVGSISIAKAKAFTATAFSSSENALSTR